MRSWHNFIGKSEVGSEVRNTFVGQIAVVVLPAESDSNELSRFQGLHQTKDLKVAGAFNLRMSRRLGVLLDNANSLLEEVAEDSDTVFFRDEHGEKVCLSYFFKHENL